MPNRKALIWFIILSYLISWPLFWAPLALQQLESEMLQLLSIGFWALAMWGPGIAAIITTLAINKQPFNTLCLNKIGSIRYYLWAWFLPPILTAFSGLISVLVGAGQLDLAFTFLQDQMNQSSTQLPFSLNTLFIIQIVSALLLGPVINLLFALGEEIGWRGFLLPNLMPLGQWKALIISGIIWGLWHAPVIAQGHNYPDHPYLGILLMTVFCVLFGIIIGWLYLNTRSPWVAGITHGSLNASAGLPFLFLSPGFDTALGGMLTSLTGCLIMVLFIGWLLLTKRLPVQVMNDN